MVDLHGQYLRLKEEIDKALLSVIDSSAFINGPQVKTFSAHLAEYLEIPYVIPCGNGTDALQIAMMALELQPGDEVIVPAFTYVAAAEVVALLGMIPVWVDVDARTFNINPDKIEAAITERTKAIVAVHLFGQSCDMASILRVAEKYGLFVIEDNAQSMGALYRDGLGNSPRKTGTMGHIGTTSFFPSKPLACYGDGGALFTADPQLGERIRMIANHGQKYKYYHQIIGCNSRLDTLQAAILDVKLKYLDVFNEARRVVAARYDEAFASMEGVLIPEQTSFSSHVYHQYTLQITGGKRDAVQAYLREKGIPSMVYYPLPLHQQEAFKRIARMQEDPVVATRLCRSVLSLPIHTEMGKEEQDKIIQSVKSALEIVY